MSTQHAQRQEKPLAPDAKSRAHDKDAQNRPPAEDENAEEAGEAKVLDPALLPIGDPAGAA